MSKQILAAVAVVAVLAAAYLLFTRPEPEKAPGSTWSLPELENFDRLAIRRGDVEMVIDKAADGWRIQEPIQFNASSRQMDSVVSLFASEDSRAVVDSEKEATANNLTRYGFDDATVHVALFDGGQQEASFTVGETEATDAGATRTWVRPDESDVIYRLNRDLRSVLDRDLPEWRDGEVLALSREERDQIDTVEIHRGDQTIRVTKAAPEGSGESTDTEAHWTLTEPAGMEADPELIARWTRGLDHLTADDFADGVTAADAGLEPPEIEVVIHRGDAAQYRVQIGRNVPSATEGAAEGSGAAAILEGTGAVATGTGEGTGAAMAQTPTPPVPAPEADQRRYVRLDDGPIFIVSATDAERFIRSTGDFRPRGVLSLSSDDFQRIEIADHDGTNLVLVRNDAAPVPEGSGEETAPAEPAEATWRLEQPEAIDPVDMTELRRLLSNIAEMEAQRFADEMTAAEAGLDSPRRVITVALADGTSHRIEVGSPSEALGEDGESSADHYVRVDGGNIFVLRDFKVRHLLKSVEDLRPDAPGEGDGDEG